MTETVRPYGDGPAELAPEDHETLQAMYGLGGSFASHLAMAWMCADATNFAKLKAAFPELWDQYADMARMQKARKGGA